MKNILLVKSTKIEVEAMRKALRSCRGVFGQARITVLGFKLTGPEQEEFMGLDAEKHIIASAGGCALVGLLPGLWRTGFDSAVLVAPPGRPNGPVSFFIRLVNAKERRVYDPVSNSMSPLALSAAELDGLAHSDHERAVIEPGAFFLLRRLILAFCMTAFVVLCISVPLSIKRLFSI